MSHYTKQDFTELDLRNKSNLTLDDFAKALDKTPFGHLSFVFLEAERRFHVNALYLCAHAIWESSWGMSKLVRTKFNVFGLAQDPNLKHTTAYEYYDLSESIYAAAKIISQEYLDVNGINFNGPTLSGICRTYADNDENWVNAINLVMNTLIRRANKRKSKPIND